MKILKWWKFKNEAKEAKMKLFKKMKDETDHEKWKQLKEEYDTYDKIGKPGGHISNEQIFKVCGSLLMLGLVLKFEQMDIICTKAWSWIRPREF